MSRKYLIFISVLLIFKIVSSCTSSQVSSNKETVQEVSSKITSIKIVRKGIIMVLGWFLMKMDFYLLPLGTEG